MATFKVGDKFRLISGGGEFPLWGASNGEIYEIVGALNYYHGNAEKTYEFYYNDKRNTAYAKPYQMELVKPGPTKNQRITTLEETVEQLKARIEQLGALVETSNKPKEFTVDFSSLVPKNTNEQRKEVITEAKAFVEDVTERISQYGHGNELGKHGEITTEARGWIIKVEYVVNAEKSTVVAILRKFHCNDIVAKGIAKCAPDDVFNADIGKAIALGRALGLDVSKFEQAVKPTEVVVGMVVKGAQTNGWYCTSRKFTLTSETADRYYYSEASKYHGEPSNDWIEPGQIGAIIDDTEAQY